MAFSLSSIASRRVLGSLFRNERNAYRSLSFSASRAASRFQLPHARNLSSAVLRAVETNSGQKKRGSSFLMTGAIIAGVGLGFASLRKSPIQCDATQQSQLKEVDRIYLPDRPPPPASSVSLYELGFGSVAGLCAGVFVKKGAKAAAWFLGGIFVLLQYLGSLSLVRVDWGRASTKFENLFYTKDAIGTAKPPTILSLWTWTINFLTADFQPRASFIAGFALGLRVG